MAGISNEGDLLPADDLAQTRPCEGGEFSPFSFWDRAHGIFDPLVKCLLQRSAKAWPGASWL